MPCTTPRLIARTALTAMPMVTLNGLKQHYKLEGEGPETIVLVNGLADDLETWAEQMGDFLGAGYRVLRFDNRGIGKSDRPEGPYTTAQMAEDAKALVDRQRQQLVLGVPGLQRVVDLLGREPLEAVAVGRRERLHELPARVVGGRQVTDLPRRDQRRQRAVVWRILIVSSANQRPYFSRERIQRDQQALQVVF